MGTGLIPSGKDLLSDNVRVFASRKRNTIIISLVVRQEVDSLPGKKNYCYEYATQASDKTESDYKAQTHAQD